MDTVETKITGTLVTEKAKYNIKIIYHLLARPQVNIDRDLNSVPPLYQYHDDRRCAAWHHRLNLAETNLIPISTEKDRDCHCTAYNHQWLRLLMSQVFLSRKFYYSLPWYSNGRRPLYTIYTTVRYATRPSKLPHGTNEHSKYVLKVRIGTHFTLPGLVAVVRAPLQ